MDEDVGSGDVACDEDMPAFGDVCGISVSGDVGHVGLIREGERGSILVVRLVEPELVN